MRTFTLAALACLFAGSLLAVEATIVMAPKDGKPQENREALDIQSETISGIDWRDKKTKNAGVRIDVWDCEAIRYAGLDEFNSLATKFKARAGAKLETDAVTWIEQKDNKALDRCNDLEKQHVKLTAMYYFAKGLSFQERFEDAIKAFIEYLKEAERFTATLSRGKAGYPASPITGVKFNSPTGNAVADAGALHRLYLDALEGLGDAYASSGDLENASKKGYDPLERLIGDLVKSRPNPRYYDWSIRALRAAGNGAKIKKDWTNAVAIYDRLKRAALAKNGNKESRESNEADLEVGLLQVSAGKLTEAGTRFNGQIRKWEQSQGKPISGEWISADMAWYTAGCYYGTGMIEFARAKEKGNADVDDWAKSLTHFSRALSIFAAGAKLRAECLLAAADASARMAAASKDKNVASRHADTASVYLYELTREYRGSAAAQDPRVGEVSQLVDKYRITKK